MNDTTSVPWTAPKLSGYLSCGMIGLILGSITLAAAWTLLENRIEFAGLDHRELPIITAFGISIRTLLSYGLVWPLALGFTMMLVGGKRAGPGLKTFTNALLLAALGLLTAAAVAFYILAKMLQWWSPYLHA